MMDTQRIIALVIFSVSALMLWQKWTEHNAPHVPTVTSTMPAIPSQAQTLPAAPTVPGQARRRAATPGAASTVPVARASRLPSIRRSRSW